MFSFSPSLLRCTFEILGWVASHVVDFFNDLCIIWQVISSDPYLSTFKPGEGFPSGVEYRWAMNPHEPAMSVSAPQYVSLVLDWISQQLNDPKWFPEEQEMEVRVYSTPKFAILCGQMFRRMFRIYGIIYSSFFGTVEALEMAPHLNSCFKHFMYFCVEFALLPKREVEPLDVLVKPVRKLYLAEKAKN